MLQIIAKKNLYWSAVSNKGDISHAEKSFDALLGILNTQFRGDLQQLIPGTALIDGEFVPSNLKNGIVGICQLDGQNEIVRLDKHGDYDMVNQIVSKFRHKLYIWNISSDEILWVIQKWSFPVG